MLILEGVASRLIGECLALEYLLERFSLVKQILLIVPFFSSLHFGLGSYSPRVHPFVENMVFFLFECKYSTLLMHCL